MNFVDLARTALEIRSKYRKGEIGTEDVLLVCTRDRPPSGENILLFGRFGPRSSWIANVQKRDDGRYDVVAYFPADKILKYLEDHGCHDGKGGS